MNKYQIDDLAIEILGTTRVLEAYKETLTEWFEKNPQEPVIVGLSDEQLKDCLSKISCGTRQDMINTFKTWYESQIFVQPEVKEVPVGLSDEQIWDLANHLDGECSSRHNMDKFIKEWAKPQTFVQPEVKEVAVGLTDEQIDRFW